MATNKSSLFSDAPVRKAVLTLAVPTVMNAELAHLIRSEGYSKQAGFGVALGGIRRCFCPCFARAAWILRLCCC